MTTVPQPSLSGGELAPSLHGRVDLALYQSSLKTCRNFIPQAYGGARNRAGSRFVAYTKSAGTTPRLVAFTFSATQSYLLEFTGGIGGANGTMRIYTQGRRVAYDSVAVDAITTAAVPGWTAVLGQPAEMPIPWQIGDIRDLRFSQTGDVLTVTHQDYKPVQIERRGHAWWGWKYLTDSLVTGPWQDENLEKGVKVTCDKSTAGLSATVTATGKAIFDGKVGMLMKIKQQGFGTPWQLGEAVVTNAVRRSDGKYYRATAAGTCGTLRPSHTDGTWSDGGVVWEYVHSGYGVVRIESVAPDKLSAGVTILSNLPSDISGAVSAPTAPVAISGVFRNEINGKTIFASGTHSIPINSSIFVDFYVLYVLDGNAIEFSRSGVAATATSASQIELDFSYSQFGEPNSPLNTPYGGCTFTVVQSSQGANGATYKWTFGAWGGDQKYPTCSGYFQQRQAFSGTYGAPQTTWMSRVGDFKDFSVSEPIQDDDSLTFTLASARIDAITNMLPMDKLVFMTAGGNWISPADTMTPSNLGAKLQNYFGSSNLAPLGVGNTVLYHGIGGTIRDMAYDYASDSYVGNDLTIKGNHLFRDHTILEWDFQQSPFPIIWCVRNDGVLLALTYLKEEKVVGWSHHDLTGIVESVCVLNECNEDHVYVAVNRGGVRTVECIYARVDDEYEACFVDSALTYDGRNSTNSYVVITGTFIPGGTVNVNYTKVGTNDPAGIFTAGTDDEGCQIVLVDSTGALHRLTLKVGGYSSPTQRTATVGEVALHVSLQGTQQTTWAFARKAFVAPHLASKTVSYLSEGEAGVGTMSGGGSLTLPTPSAVITCGLPITAELETLPLVVPGNQGPLLEAAKLIHTVRVMVEASRSTFIGPDADNLTEVVLRDPDDEMTLITHGQGMLEVNTVASWRKNGQFLIQHTKPYPLSVLGLYPDIAAGVP